MKSKIRGAAAQLKRTYTEPWTARSAWINVCIWSGMLLWSLCSVVLGMLGDVVMRWVWLTLNVGVIVFQVTMLKLSVQGLIWRKEQDRSRAEAERFMAIMEATFGDR